MARWSNNTIVPVHRSDDFWGRQIRSYVLAPYTLVKDLRTGRTRTDIEAVLNGDIDDFLRDGMEIEARRRRVHHSVILE